MNFLSLFSSSHCLIYFKLFPDCLFNVFFFVNIIFYVFTLPFFFADSSPFPLFSITSFPVFMVAHISRSPKVPSLSPLFGRSPRRLRRRTSFDATSFSLRRRSSPTTYVALLMLMMHRCLLLQLPTKYIRAFCDTYICIIRGVLNSKLFSANTSYAQRGFMGTIAGDYNRQHSVNRRKSPAIYRSVSSGYVHLAEWWLLPKAICQSCSLQLCSPKINSPN